MNNDLGIGDKWYRKRYIQVSMNRSIHALRLNL